MLFLGASGSRTADWKTEVGTTQKIATRRDGAKIIWRLSLATIDNSGRSRHFPEWRAY